MDDRSQQIAAAKARAAATADRFAMEDGDPVERQRLIDQYREQLDSVARLEAD